MTKDRICWLPTLRQRFCTNDCTAFTIVKFLNEGEEECCRILRALEAIAQL